jgi:hypothetical protein
MRRSSLSLSILAACMCCSLSISAQMNNTLYFMQGIPQANRVNPAYQPAANLYVGIPLLASVHTEFTSNSLSYGDVIYRHPLHADSLITFLHPLGNKEAFMGKLKPLNVATSDMGLALINVGFRTEAGYFAVELNSRWDGNIYYPGDLATLLLEGTEEGKQYRMDGAAADISFFDEIAVGWSYMLSEEWRIGARAKFLFGIGNLSTRESKLNLAVAENRDWILRSDMQFDASLPFAEVTYDEEGRIEDITLKDEIKDPVWGKMPAYLFNFRNFGLGLDLGAEYRPTEELRLSLSLVDLGYIRWTDEVHQIDYTTLRAGEEGTYTFRGLELNPFELDDEYSFGDFVDSSLSELADSLYSFMQFTEGGAYSKMLTAKLYAGASYAVTDWVDFGILSRTDFLNGKVAQQFTASANFRVAPVFDASLSYSYIASYFMNVGMGFSLNLGPVNLFMISDNALNLLFWPDKTQSANFWFGLNLIFGRPKDDLPLVQ